MVFSLNIYGANDEILKTVGTDIVRWGVYMQAVALQDAIEDKSVAEQFAAINEFIKKIFFDLTDEDLANADGNDVINTFRQLVSKANAIGKTSKNV